jgi:hypothetical protein
VIGLSIAGFSFRMNYKTMLLRNMVHKNWSKLFCCFLCNFGLSACLDIVKNNSTGKW